MIRQLLKFIFLILPQALFSQGNLVPNPSFEIYDSCPTSSGQITEAIPWFQPFMGASSTDYFNACAAIGLSVPINVAGYQSAFNGVGYAGFISWKATSVREYLEIELLDSLISGTEYCISFYISLGDMSMYACDGVGAYLSKFPIYYSSPFYGVLSFQPQIDNPQGNIINDTSNWMLIHESFIALGGEKYMTIGNFRSDSLTDTLLINSTGYPISYFYIDDVSVVQGSCSVGINNNHANTDNIIVYPNPTTGIIHLTNSDDAFIDVSDVSGRNILHLRNKQNLNLEQFENGIYYITITSTSGEITRSKILLNK